MRISTHRLLINKPTESLSFYQNLLGMTLLTTQKNGESTHYFLSYETDEQQPHKQATLELVYNPSQRFHIAKQPNINEGYWKFTIAVDDIEAMQTRLAKAGVMIGECFSVPELAYLCHLYDPNGYNIELIEKTLKNVATSKTTASTSAMTMADDKPTFNLSTLRVKDADDSLAFYEQQGMRLIYTYRSDARNMTLYFLISEQDMAEFNNHPAPTPEEKMWQFPYTILELQQIDGTRENPDFHYRVGDETGFLGLLMTENKESAKSVSQSCKSVTDPDGFVLGVRS